MFSKYHTYFIEILAHNLYGVFEVTPARSYSTKVEYDTGQVLETRSQFASDNKKVILITTSVAHAEFFLQKILENQS